MSNNKLEHFYKLDNIAEEIDEDTLRDIAADLYRGFEDDVASRAEWESMIDEGIKLASMTHEVKNWPWEKASNLKYPAITNAAIQFAAYMHPEIVRNDRVFEAQVTGWDEDGKKAEKVSRVTKFHNYQLLTQNGDWERSLDKLLHMLPIQAVVYKKIFYDPIENKIENIVCPYKEVYVNTYIQSLEKARRITHKMVKHRNEILARQREDLFLPIELKECTVGEKRATPYTEELLENDFEILEVHCWLDLDGDDFEEPYIVTMLSETQEILRIVARYNPKTIKRNKKGEVYRIKPTGCFIDYHYIPSFDGTYHSQSISSLLFAYTKGINSVLNQLINAGTLATTAAGFMGRGCRVKGGQVQIAPGKIMQLDSASELDLNKSIKMLEFKEPSNVLFQLLGFLAESAKEIANITDVTTGKQNAQNVQSGTIQTLAEKGLKPFSDILKRVYGSLTRELRLIFELNKEFLEDKDYKKVLDYREGEYSKDGDFDEDNFDIYPVANPNLSSDLQRTMRAQQEMMLISEGGPLQGDNEATYLILKDYLESMNATRIEEKLAKFKSPQPPAPKPEVIEIQAKIETEAEKIKQNQQKIEHKFQLDMAKLSLDREKDMATIELTRAQALKALAEAQVIGNEAQFNQAEQELEALLSHNDIALKQKELEVKQADMESKRQQTQQQIQLQQQKMETDKQMGEMKIQHESQKHQQELQFNAQQADQQRQHESEQSHQQLISDLYHNDQERSQKDNQFNTKLGYESSQKEADRGLDYTKHKETQAHDRDSQERQHRADETAQKRDIALAKSSNNSVSNGSNKKPKK